VFTHVTVSPTWIVTFCGVKANPPMVTFTVAARDAAIDTIKRQIEALRKKRTNFFIPTLLENGRERTRTLRPPGRSS
jgi:hypothetical protein